MLDATHAEKVVPGRNGVFLPTLVVNGQVIGTWKRAAKAGELAVTISPFDAGTTIRPGSLRAAAAAYGQFVGAAAVELIDGAELTATM